jgi:hypothetical protein
MSLHPHLRTVTPAPEVAAAPCARSHHGWPAGLASNFVARQWRCRSPSGGSGRPAFSAYGTGHRCDPDDRGGRPQRRLSREVSHPARSLASESRSRSRRPTEMFGCPGVGVREPHARPGHLQGTRAGGARARPQPRTMCLWRPDFRLTTRRAYRVVRASRTTLKAPGSTQRPAGPRSPPAGVDAIPSRSNTQVWPEGESPTARTVRGRTGGPLKTRFPGAEPLHTEG